MEVKQVADLVGVSSDTVRRWCSVDYTPFLSADATPEKGKERRLNRHDVRVLAYVAASRNNADDHDEIKRQLAAWQRNGWAELPEVPEEWTAPQSDGRIALAEAADRAHEMATLAAAQIQITVLRERLQEAEERAGNLQRDLDHIRATEYTTTSELGDLRVQLATARGEVEALKARLAAYSLGRGDQPVSLLILVAVTAAAVLVAVLVVFVAARLLL